MSRLAAGFLVLFSSIAFADDAEPPASPPKTEEAAPATSSKFPLRVVKILMDSEQVLLFDKNRGRHVLVEVGDTVGDYTVSAIGEEEVTLAGKDMPVEILLAAPGTKPKKAAAKKPVAEADVAPEVTPEDPYAEAKPVAKAPADPYADEEAEEAPAVEKPIRAVQWGQPKAEGEKTTSSPFANAEPPKPSADVAKRGTMSKTEEASVMADAMVAATAAPTNAPAKLSKKDVNAALADFGALAGSIDAAFAPAGLEIKQVKAGSVFAKAGLAAGDVVTAVDGKPLKTLDDAADLYARAGAMKAATVQVIRGGKPHTLRVTIQ